MRAQSCRSWTNERRLAVTTGGAPVLPLRHGELSLEAETVRVEELLAAAAPHQLVFSLPPLPAQADLRTQALCLYDQ